MDDQNVARTSRERAADDDPEAQVRPIRADGVPLASPFGDEPEPAMGGAPSGSDAAPIAGPPRSDAVWVAPTILEGADPMAAVAAEVAAQTVNDTPEDEGEV